MKFTYMLAPLEQTSDNALRTLCYKYGADLTFTEMTRYDSLAKKNKSSLRKIELHDQTPTQIQIVGGKEEALKKFLADFTPSKGFKGFNLNLGCPSPYVIKQGIGSAMIKRITKVNKILELIQEKYPCSIKMRLGMNGYEKFHKVYLNLIKSTNAEFYIVHARHGNEHYDSPADNSVYKECLETGKTIIANGDILDRDDVKRLQNIGVHGVMLGRAAVYNPGIFQVLKGKEQIDFKTLREEYLALVEKFQTPYAYQHNVLSRLGNIENLQKKKYQLDHVQG